MASPIKRPYPLPAQELREALRQGYTTDLAYTFHVSERLISQWRIEMGVDRAHCPYREVKSELRRTLLSAVSAHTATSLASMTGHAVTYVRRLLHALRAEGLASYIQTGCTFYWHRL